MTDQKEENTCRPRLDHPDKGYTPEELENADREGGVILLTGIIFLIVILGWFFAS